MFRATMLPAGDQQAASSVHYTTSCKHSLVLLRMGEIIARNMLSWFKLLIKLLLLHLVGYLYCCINDARSHKHQTFDLHLPIVLKFGSFKLLQRYGLVTGLQSGCFAFTTYLCRTRTTGISVNTHTACWTHKNYGFSPPCIYGSHDHRNK